MKNIISALVCMLFSVYSFGQCDYSLKMMDSYGDGWNGNSIDVLVDGVVVLDDITMASGSEEIVTFQVTTDSDVTTLWNGGGSWAYEVTYEVLDNNGDVAGSGAENVNIESGMITAVCPIIECSYTVNMMDSYGDGWNGNSIDVLVDGVVVLDDLTLASGSAGSETFIVAEGSDVTTIWNGGGSWAYEVTYDILDTDGIVVGSGAENVNIESGTITAVCPSCPSPMDLAVSGISTTGAIVSWTSGAEAVDWEYELVISGETPTEVGTSTSDNPFTVTGCYANTSYDFYIRTNCGGTMSSWASVSFTTLCDAISDIPFYETFNSDSSTENCWTVLNENGDTDLWNMSYTFNTYQGDEVAMIYTDYNSGNNDDWLISPGLVLTGNERLRYQMRVQSSFEPNDFEVLLSTTGINPTDFTNVLLPVAEYDNTTYVEYTIDLSAYSETSYIAFHVPNGGLDGWRIYIDDFIVEPIPTCVAPTDLSASASSFTEATLGWIGNDGAESYEVVVQAPGSGFPTEAGTVVTETSLDVTDLTPNTTYEFYVRTDCGAEDGLSNWSGPLEFYMGYCESVPSSNDGQGITQVVLNSTTFTSAGDVTYEDFTSPTVDVSQSIVAELYISFATGYTYNTNIWVDFNNDLVFDNDTELLYSGESLFNNPTILDASFLMPDAPLGVYNMRIGTADSGQFNPNPCYNGSWGVTVDMTINVVEAPSCIPPSALTADNITGTSADLSWTGNDTNVSWEYVLQLNGEPAPTGSGTSIDTTGFQATGLDFSTTYDLYVMALCGGDLGVTDWVGPYTFTTSQQVYYDLVCDLATPAVVDYCYTNNDDMFWVFTSDTGFPLELTFNAGTIDTFGDSLIIYDGPDNTGTVLFNSDTSDIGDFTGIVVESTSDAMYVEVNSDGFGSCESSTFYTPWNFEVLCKTCITQSVDFEVYGSCEPVQEFYVEAHITDMGDALSLELTDSYGTVQTATSTGFVAFGPYTPNDQITISVVNSDDASCSVESDSMTFLCPPPPNECSIVYAGEDTTFCSDNDPATVLSATYHIFGQDTNSYDITSQEDCPMPALTGGTPTSLTIDDRWSEVVDLGFDFCFFGGTYDQIIIGSNGVLSFEIENANGYNGWSLDADDTIPNSTNVTLADANIFGVSHDINPNTCGDINYMVLGSSPSRQFVVNYSEVCHFGSSCSENTTTSQIILYESSNTIDINIFDKPLCVDWNEGLAAVGVQNMDGTIGFAPPERNTGAWETSNEFWRFTPSVGEANYEFAWYDGDTLVGTDDTITVYPTETTEYTAAVTYNLCNGETATVTDTVLVEITPTPIPVAVEDEIFACDGVEQMTLEVSVDPSLQIPDAVVYYWTYDNVDIVSGLSEAEGGTVMNLGEGGDHDLLFGDYVVTAYNVETGCFADTTITVSQGFTPELEDGTSFDKCANGDVELSVNITNDEGMSNAYLYTWVIDGEIIAEDESGIFIHGPDLNNGPVEVIVTDLASMCSAQTVVMVDYYMNQNCVDIPQGISPNGDGLNDCLVLDHLEAQEDIVKAEIYNRYGIKVFELNDYVDHWCGQDASDGDISSNELLPVGTYFYVIQYASDREPTISWIYLNY